MESVFFNQFYIGFNYNLLLIIINSYKFLKSQLIILMETYYEQV